MTGFSHATTGILIALAVPRPAISLPLALASHFLLDRLPHWGSEMLDGSHARFRRIILLDAALGLSFVLCMMLLVPEHWVLVGMGALFATLPDLMWLPKFIRETRGHTPKPFNILMRWHARLQFERRWGIYTEALWLIGMLALLFKALSV